MAIYLAGTKEQKERYLKPLAEGKRFATFALTEPAAGSDAGSIKTNARRNGQGFVLNGSKTFITNGSFADVCIVFAVTDAVRATRGGISAFIVEKDWPGYRAGKPEKKMGIRGSYTSDLFFEDVMIPEENLLGELGQGYPVALKTLDVARVSLSAQCLGGAKELLDLSIKHANERVQFGQPIANQEAIQFMLADMAANIYQIESIVYRTAWLIDHQLPHRRESAICKLVASKAVCRIADKAVQIHGGLGYMREYPIERLYRDARINPIFEGTNEIQHLVIARDLIRKGSY
jgi:alkylation response protein AidB-like acyl-CoA dehydrogenase